MNRLLFSGALGALAMYFLDGDSGRRRRTRTRERMAHAARVLHEVRRVTTSDALVERVRTALERVVSHPHAIEVSAADGHVTLQGPILADDVKPLLRRLRHVAGVRGVNDELTVYRDPSHAPALHDGSAQPSQRFELLQENWSPAARLLSGGLGAGLLLSATRAEGGSSALLGLAGTGLLARAVTNRGLRSLVGLGNATRGIVVEKAIQVDASVEDVFRFWSDFQSFPRFMSNVREVEVSEDRSRWTVSGPAGIPVRWTSEITRIEANRAIEWRSTAGATVRHLGWVRFTPANGGTRINVRLSYLPLGGAFGHAVATLFGADPKTEMDADLLRMKSTIETGLPREAQRLSAPRES